MNLLREYIKTITEGSDKEPVRKSLDIPVPADLRDIQKRMELAGKELYLVGGAVRDALMGKTPKDYDVATNAPPEKVTKILSRDPQLQIKPVGEAFGVVLVKTLAGNEYEVATFRQDIGSGRRPDDVSFTDMETDAQRRDLTMNALFYDMAAQEVVDFVGGIQDIEDGVVRPVGKASDRFSEDPLRILRAIRFAGRTGSELDKETKQAILDDNELREVSAERIRDEFIKGITSAQDIGYFLSLTEELGLFEQIFPGLDIDISGQTTQNVPVQIASMLGNNNPSDVGKGLKGVKYSNDETKLIQFLVSLKSITRETAPQLKKDFNRFKLSPSEITEFAEVVGAPTPMAAEKFLEYVVAPPAGSPRDLMAQGIKGPDLGIALANAEMSAYDEIVGEQSLRKYIRALLFEVSTLKHKGDENYFRVELGRIGYAEGGTSLRFKDCQSDVDALEQTPEYLGAEEKWAKNAKPRTKLMQDENGKWEMQETGELEPFTPIFYDVANAWIHDEGNRGKGHGKEIYKAFIDKASEYAKRNGGVFIGAHHCTLGSGTSEAAKWVWKSITKDYTSSGDVIFIGL